MAKTHETPETFFASCVPEKTVFPGLAGLPACGESLCSRSATRPLKYQAAWRNRGFWGWTLADETQFLPEAGETIVLRHLLLLWRNNSWACRKLRFLKTHFRRNLFSKWPLCQETTVTQHDFNTTYFTRQTVGWGWDFSHFLINPSRGQDKASPPPAPELHVLLLMRLCRDTNASSTIIYILLNASSFSGCCNCV